MLNLIYSFLLAFLLGVLVGASLIINCDFSALTKPNTKKSYLPTSFSPDMVQDLHVKKGSNIANFSVPITDLTILFSHPKPTEPMTENPGARDSARDRQLDDTTLREHSAPMSNQRPRSGSYPRSGDSDDHDPTHRLPKAPKSRRRSSSQQPHHDPDPAIGPSRSPRSRLELRQSPRSYNGANAGESSATNTSLDSDAAAGSSSAATLSSSDDSDSAISRHKRHSRQPQVNPRNASMKGKEPARRHGLNRRQRRAR